jgi:hypothetical protein
LTGYLDRVRALNESSISNLVLELEPSYDDTQLEKLEFYQGIVLKPRHAIGITPSDKPQLTRLDPNTVRMGALDLELDDREKPQGSKNAEYLLTVRPDFCNVPVHVNVEIAVQRGLPARHDDPHGAE